jgi:replicative DNA helicase
MLFRTILDLHRRRINPDIVTLRDALTRSGDLDAVGGVGYLMELGEFVPGLANLPHYAAIVREKAVQRRLLEATAQIAGMVHSGQHSADETLSRAEQVIFQARGEITTKTHEGWQGCPALVGEVLDRIFAPEADQDGQDGVRPGLVELDGIHGVFRNGDHVILAARPSMGKTATACTIALEAAKRGRIVGIFSQETEAGRIMERLISQEAQVDGKRMRDRRLSELEIERVTQAASVIYELPLFIDDQNCISPAEMRSRARRLRARAGGLDMIINDYLQLGASDADDRRLHETTRDRVVSISRGLKGLAREMSIPVMTLSQVSRACERRDDKRPILSDLMESGNIEADADVVAFLYRASYYARAEDRGPVPGGIDELEWIVAKQRDGPTGFVKLGFIDRYTQVVNLSMREDSF